MTTHLRNSTLVRCKYTRARTFTEMRKKEKGNILENLTHKKRLSSEEVEEYADRLFKKKNSQDSKIDYRRAHVR
jgi:hypothetical protein